jgi:hypothetical protein
VEEAAALQAVPLLSGTMFLFEILGNASEKPKVKFKVVSADRKQIALRPVLAVDLFGYLRDNSSRHDYECLLLSQRQQRTLCSQQNRNQTHLSRRFDGRFLAVTAALEPARSEI